MALRAACSGIEIQDHTLHRTVIRENPQFQIRLRTIFYICFQIEFHRLGATRTRFFQIGQKPYNSILEVIFPHDWIQMTILL